MLPGIRLSALFGPQHGFLGEKQDNMIESADERDPRYGVPVYSLYGDVRQPTPDMLSDLDALVFDLQDVGVRVYTFVWTMTLAMEACRASGIPFVVLDRPNPIGGVVREGRVLDPAWRSFVGQYPIPLRHGLTAGELARLANEAFGIGCELVVVPCEGWQRSDWFDRTGLPFVLPSPNLPTLDTCAVYPGMVLLEGTNLSEGRGTTRPFEVFGAPFLDAEALVERLREAALPGVAFRPCAFEPAFQKHAGERCQGAQIHVVDRDVVRPVTVALTILRAVRDLAGEALVWRAPPYEYEFEHLPIDILWGGDDLRRGLDEGASVEDLLAGTDEALGAFGELARPFLLY